MGDNALILYGIVIGWLLSMTNKPVDKKKASKLRIWWGEQSLISKIVGLFGLHFVLGLLYFIYLVIFRGI